MADLRLWFDFNETSGTIALDQSGYGNDGTLIGGVGRCVNHNDERALIFNGTDGRIRIPLSKTTLNNLTEFTYLAWINWDGGGTDSRIFAKTYKRLRLNNTLGKLRGFVDLDTQDAISRGSQVLETDRWYFVAMTFSSTGDKYVHLFIDGQEVTYDIYQVGQGSPVDDSGIRQRIGNSSGLTSPFSGLIDEARIYSGTLNLSEIQAIYDASKANYLPLAETLSFSDEEETDLKLFLKFEETSGTIAYDSSQYGHDGVKTDTAFLINQQNERALIFNGTTSFIQIPASEEFEEWVGITVSAWINSHEVPATRHIYIVDQGYGSQDSWLLQQQSGGSLLKFIMYLDGADRTAWGSKEIEDNTWYHVVGTYDGKTVKLYIDGELDAQQGYTKSAWSTPGQIQVSKAGESCFDGFIDDVRIYNRALSLEEIQNIYNATKANYDPLTETIGFQETTSKAYSVNLVEALTASPQLGKTYHVYDQTAAWYLILEDELFFKPQKVLQENLVFTDTVSRYLASPHETFKIEIYRNGLLLDVDLTDIESFEFTKVLTDEVGGGEVVFENSELLDFREGDEIRIYYGSEGVGLWKLMFTGEIDLVERFWDEDEAEQKMKLSFQDYGKLLLEYKITESFATVTNINTIIETILSNIKTTHDPPYPNERKINLSHVDSSNKTRTVDFVGEALFDCLGKLAFITESEFYVDPHKRLKFFPRASGSVKGNLEIDDFEDYNYEISEELLANTVEVYGYSNKPHPMPTDESPDPWTDSLDYWNTDQGAYFLDTFPVRAGSFSVNNDNLGTSPIYLNLEITFPDPVNLTPKYAFRELAFAAKVVSGAELTAFPKLDVLFELEDSVGNKVSYPAEQTYDLLKTFESPTEAAISQDSAQHETSSTSYVCHSTIEVSCAGNERITLTKIQDIIRNTWYGYPGFAKVTYQFGSGSEILIGETQTEDPAEELDINTADWMACTTSTSWQDGVEFGMGPGPYTRIRVAKLRAQGWSSGAATAWHRFSIQRGASTVYSPSEWGFTGRSWNNFEWSAINISGDPGQNVTVRTQDKGTVGNQSCSRNLYSETYWGTTAEKTYLPPVHVTGGLGEALKVRFYYKVNASGVGVYSKNREAGYFKSQEVIPPNLSEVRIPVGPSAEQEGQWVKTGADFNWNAVAKFNIRTSVSWRGGTSEWARLIIDWFHFDKGKWFGKWKDATSMTEPPTGHGIRFREIFDDTLFSDAAAMRWAYETITRFKDPLYFLTNVRGILDNIEEYNPGDRFIIVIPETGSSGFFYLLRKITFSYDEEEGAEAVLTLERESLSELVANGNFSSGDFSNWETDEEFPEIGTEGYSAPYCCEFTASDQSIYQWVEETPTEEIYSVGLWIKIPDSCPYWGNRIKVRFIYDEGDPTEITNLGATQPWAEWHYYDLTSYLEPGEVLVRIEIDISSFAGEWILVDDISIIKTTGGG